MSVDRRLSLEHRDGSESGLLKFPNSDGISSEGFLPKILVSKKFTNSFELAGCLS